MKDLQREKMLTLRYNNDNFEAVITLSENVREGLAWWKSQIMLIYNPIRGDEYKIEIFSDVFQSGWGIYCRVEISHGFWNMKDRKNHINYLELLSAFFGLKFFATQLEYFRFLHPLGE